MTRTWKMLGMTAALAAALAGDRCVAQTADHAAGSQKQDDVHQELEQLRSDTIRSFQAAKKDIDATREDIARLRKELNEVRNAMPPILRKWGDVPPATAPVTRADAQAARKEIEALKEEIARLDKSLDELKNAGPPRTRTSAYPPLGRATGTGTIRLANTYPANVTIIVNGESYTLAPGETRVLADRPAGRFTYEVVGVQPQVERTLVANRAFPILVHP